MNQKKENIDDFINPCIAKNSIDELEQRMNKKKKESWSKREEMLLLRLIACFDANEVDWDKISKAMIGNNFKRTRQQCMEHWENHLKDGLKKTPWTEDEEEKLLQLVEQFGDKSWMKIAREMEQRSDVQCRYHYHQMIRHQKKTSKQPPPLPTNPYRLIELDDDDLGPPFSAEPRTRITSHANGRTYEVGTDNKWYYVIFL